MIKRLSLCLAMVAAPARAEVAVVMPLVDPEWLQAHLHDPDLLIVDVRDPDSDATTFAFGHIEGAVSAPFASFGWQPPADGLPPAQILVPALGTLGVSDEVRVVLVSDGINDFEFAKATRAYWVLKALGHADVSILDGGEVAWVAAGLPVVLGPTIPHAAAFTPHPRPELAISTGEVSARLGQITLIDARSAAEYLGKRKVGLVARAGTLPGAWNLPHSALYQGQFAKPAAIRDLMQAAHIPADRPIVTFCNVGLWSSLDWFALSEVAQLPYVMLYPGSMAAWTLDPDRLVQLHGSPLK
ncbi:MAG: rhodanese-like domain-containing protein [Pseudomonadota bacterium]